MLFQKIRFFDYYIFCYIRRNYNCPKSPECPTIRYLSYLVPKPNGGNGTDETIVTFPPCQCEYSG